MTASLVMAQGRPSGGCIAPVSSRAGTRGGTGPAVQAAPGAGAPGTDQHRAEIAGRRVEAGAFGRSRRRGISAEVMAAGHPCRG